MMSGTYLRQEEKKEIQRLWEEDGLTLRAVSIRMGKDARTIKKFLQQAGHDI